MFKRAILATAVTAALALVPGERVAMAQANPEDSIHAVIDKVNEVLEAQGSELRVLSADFMTRAGSGKHGRKIVWRGKRGFGGFERADAEFVPNDVRREPWSGPANGAIDDITFAIDQSEDAVPPLGGLTGAQTTRAIRRATATWDRVKCSGLALREVPATGNVGIIGAVLNGGGGSFAITGDIVHAGFGSLTNWKQNLSDAKQRFPGLVIHADIVAVTFTMVFPGDVDGNNKADVAFHEIYYNPAVTWTVDPGRRGHDDDDDDDDNDRRGRQLVVENTFDVQTVALHEIGHALALEHYGEVYTRKDGTLDARPEAVMNPDYTGKRRHLERADIAAHCMGGWKTWPRAKNNRGRDRDD